jgi:hypothetical protein
MSHASLAKSFLAEYCPDNDLLAMVQYHDEPLAMYRQFQAKGSYNRERFNGLIAAIKDWNLFLAFNIIDGCTEVNRESRRRGCSARSMVWWRAISRRRTSSADPKLFRGSYPFGIPSEQHGFKGCPMFDAVSGPSAKWQAAINAFALETAHVMRGSGLFR